VATFTKQQRLLHSTEFAAVFSDAKKISTPEWRFYVKKTDRGYPRLGLAIAKKSIRKAVGRNRIKRLARESFRQHALPSVDIVVLANRAIDELSNQQLRERLEQCWQRLMAQ